MSELGTGVRTLRDDELSDYDRELIARIDGGWMPEFDPATARTGEAARTAAREIIEAAIGGPEALAEYLGADEPAEALPVRLSPAERAGVRAVAEQAGASAEDIVRRAVTEYLARFAQDHGDHGHAA